MSVPMFLSEVSASHTHNQDQPTMKIFFPFDRQLLELEIEEKNLTECLQTWS